MTHPAHSPRTTRLNLDREAALVFAEHCQATTFANLPSTTVAATKNQLIDTLGIAVAGAYQPGARELREFAIEMGGKAESLIWGSGVRVPAQDAARVNATMAHALDYDDTYERSFVHPAAFTVPAAIATAELIGTASGQDLITAIALGVDVACRLANSARPGVTGFVHGWHNTTLYGYFGAAVTAGKLLGLTQEQFVSALGIAYQQASGNSQAHIDGALTKRMGPGFAAAGGVLSARLALRGVQGATGVFEGSRGFFFQYHGNDYSREILFENLGEYFCGSDISFKPWPSCRGSHTAIDAALRLREIHRFAATDIERITVANAPGDFQLLDQPLAGKRAPATPVDAQFSNPWVVAAALTDGSVGLEHFTPNAITRADLLAVAGTVHTEADESLVRPGGGPGAARLEVTLVNGDTHTLTVALAKGEPGQPMSESELRQKFRDCTALAGVHPSTAEHLFAALSQLELAPDLVGLNLVGLTPEG